MRRAERGVGLVEILVGVLIGMVASVVIFQVMTVADAQKRTTTSGSDAQTTGALAMYRLEQDLQHAGYGLGRLPAEYAGCTVTGADASYATPAISFPLVPLFITDGGTSGSDQLSAIIGSSPVLFDKIAFDDSSDADRTKTLRSRVGFNVGDLLIGIKAGASPAATTCKLFQVTKTPTAPADLIQHLDDGTVTGRFNKGATPALGTQGDIINLGSVAGGSGSSGSRYVTWSVRSGTLRVNNRFGSAAADVDPAQGVEVAANVVDLQAQYGIENATTGAVTWTDAPLGAGTDWSLVRSIRVAMLVRSENLEREEVTSAAPRWPAADRALNVSGTDWKRYRYRVYEKTIALRNVIWSRS